MLPSAGVPRNPVARPGRPSRRASSAPRTDQFQNGGFTMARRIVLTAVASAVICMGVGAASAAASPVRLLLSGNGAFAVLGHWCGGISQKVYATGFATNGYPDGRRVPEHHLLERRPGQQTRHLHRLGELRVGLVRRHAQLRRDLERPRRHQRNVLGHGLLRRPHLQRRHLGIPGSALAADSGAGRPDQRHRIRLRSRSGRKSRTALPGRAGRPPAKRRPCSPPRTSSPRRSARPGPCSKRPSTEAGPPLCSRRSKGAPHIASR